MKISVSPIVGIVILMCLASASFDAFSAETIPEKSKGKDVYVQFYVGNTKNDTYNADQFDIDTTDSTIAIGGGFQVNKNMSVDIRFVSLGTYKTPDDTYEETFRAITGSILGKYPIGNSGLSLYGSVGYGLLTWEYTLNSGFFSLDVKDTGDTITAGLGVQYQIPGMEAFSISLGYDQYYFKTSSITGAGGDHSNTISFTSTSVQYKFR